MSHIKIHIAGLAALSVIVVGCSTTETATGIIETLPASAAANLIAASNVVVLDIRTPEEFATGHLEIAVNIDFYAEDFAARIGTLDRDADYVVYCRSGNRSGQAMTLFEGLNFNSVHEIGGGILEWTAAGLPLSFD